MIRSLAAAKVQSAIDSLVESGRLPRVEYPEVEVQDTKQPEHGDLATNWAMTAFKAVSAGTAGILPAPEAAKMAAVPGNPRALGDLLAEELRKDPDFEKIEVAGPGFVNLTLSARVCADLLGLVRNGSEGGVLDSESHFARPVTSPVTRHPSRINLEYVSVNPNGPITIGSGRGAAYGSTLGNVLIAAGNTVHREYYINDGVNSEQMRLFAESVKAIREGRPVPENGYKGDYVVEVAEEIAKEHGQKSDGVEWYQAQSQALMLAKQRTDLATFGVTFDTWFSEQSLHDTGTVNAAIEKLEASGIADTNEERTKVKFAKGGVIEAVEREVQKGLVDEDVPGTAAFQAADTGPQASSLPDAAKMAAVPGSTLWLRSTLFGDDMDRVLRRKDGRLTYIASDVAYHADKFNRPPNADKLITVLGPDHHGYIGRLHAVVAADLMAGTPSPSPDDRAGHGEGAGGGAWTSDAELELYQGDLSLRDRCLTARKESEEKLEVLIFQLVRFVKDGKPAPMRKRDGNVYALIDLVNEIGQHVKPNGSKEEQQTAGRDVARFFYLMRHHDTTFDFDLDLAERQSDENPVFYVQYAHARVCSVIEKAKEFGFAPPPTPSPCPAQASGDREGATNIHPKERALILKIADLPYEVKRCSEDYAVSRLTTYAIELARAYHHFYDACRVINADDAETTQWRLQICEATKSALKATFDLLGISAPERMDRETPATL